MVKKSKKFENLNSLKTLSTENVILKEFITKLNKYIQLLRSEFPFFWSNFYKNNFIEKFDESLIDSDKAKKTIIILKTLFEDLNIMSDINDISEVKNFEGDFQGGYFFSNNSSPNIRSYLKEFNKTIYLFNFLMRKERINKKFINFLAPSRYADFIKVKKIVDPIIFSEDFLNLSKHSFSPKEIITRKKLFLEKKNLKHHYIFLFYYDFNRFCDRYIHAKGFKSVSERFSIISQGSLLETDNTVMENAFYKCFLTYLALEQILLAASKLGKELFGKPKNILSEEGESVSRYNDFFDDHSMADELRSMSLFKYIQYNDFYNFKDEFNQKLLVSFVNKNSNSILTPLIILRYFFVNGQLLDSDILLRENLKLTKNDEKLLFKMNLKILNWCDLKFVKCMNYFLT